MFAYYSCAKKNTASVNLFARATKKHIGFQKSAPKFLLLTHSVAKHNALDASYQMVQLNIGCFQLAIRWKNPYSILQANQKFALPFYLLALRQCALWLLC